MDAVSGTPEYVSHTKRPIKETVVVSIAFLAVFTSFQALQNLQSSLHQQQGLGVASLACIYGAIFVVSFFTPAIIYNLGIRGAFLTAFVGHFVYVASNFFPHPAILIPGSLLLGAVSCPLWTAFNTYSAALARVQVDIDLEKVPKKVTTIHAAFSNLNGIFGVIFSGSQLVGNVLSSVILFQSSYDHLDSSTSASSSSSSSLTSSLASSLTSSSSSPLSSSAMTSTCGADYCPHSDKGQHLAQPEAYVVYIMLGVFLFLDTTGIGITWFCVPTIHQPRYTGREVLRKLRSYWTAFSQPKLLLMVPLFLFRGFIFSLHIGLFTESYVSCALGIRMVGYIMAVWGFSTMLSSGLLGYAARYTGRPFLFGFVFAVDAIILAFFMVWQPHSGSVLVFCCVSALMGLVDGVWWTQCNALLAILFPAIVDSVYSVGGTWGSLSMSSSFLIAKYVCPRQRLYIAIGLMCVAVPSYVVVEIAHRWSLKSFDRTDHEYLLVSSSGDREDEEGVEETVFRDEVEGEKRGEEEGVMTNGNITSDRRISDQSDDEL